MPTAKSKTTLHKEPMYFEGILTELIEYISLGENIVVAYLPGGGKSTLVNIFGRRQDIIDTYGPEVFEENEFFGLDLNADLETVRYLLEDQLQTLLGVEGIGKGLSNLFAQGKKVYLLADNLNLDNSAVLDYLMTMRNSYGRSLRFISIVDINDFSSITTVQKSKYGSLFHQKIDVRYFTRDIAYKWMKQLEDSLQIKWTRDFKREAQDIYEITGGVPFLLKNFLRLYKKHGEVKATFESDDFDELVEMYWMKYGSEEQHFLRTVHNIGEMLNEKLAKNFSDFNLLVDGKVNGRWIEKIPVQSGVMHIQSGKVYWEGMDYMEHFTVTESKLLIAMLEEEDHIITRDEVAKIIWGPHADTKYSAWAIDKNVSRLRKKLEQLGISNYKVKTLKKLGFQLMSDF